MRRVHKRKGGRWEVGGGREMEETTRMEELISHKPLLEFSDCSNVFII